MNNSINDHIEEHGDENEIIESRSNIISRGTIADLLHIQRRIPKKHCNMR
jgi:hypothetical protein